MWQVMRKRAAFTLIELLVVVIIVAVLAAVGIPLLSASVDRARMSEAEAGLGTIRSGARAYLAEHGGYPGSTGQPTNATLSPLLGVKAGDLNGRFFDDDDFTYTAQNTSVVNGLTIAANYCISVAGNTGTIVAPRANQVNLLVRSMNDLGNLFNNTGCSGTPLN